jgi:hypothetical protein
LRRPTEWQGAQFFGEAVRRRVPGATARILLEAHVDAAAQERAHGQHHCPRGEFQSDPGDYPRDVAGLQPQVGHLLLEERQVGLVLQQAADGAL